MIKNFFLEKIIKEYTPIVPSDCIALITKKRRDEIKNRREKKMEEIVSSLNIPKKKKVKNQKESGLIEPGENQTPHDENQPLNDENQQIEDPSDENNPYFINREIVDEFRKFKIYQSKILNVVLLGKAGSGKTTIIKTLENLDYEPPGHNLFASSKEAKNNTFYLKWRDEHYQLNIIDSPGIFESIDREDQIRDNSDLINMTTTCIDNSVTKVHCFAIIQRQDVTLTPESVQTFSEFSNILPQDIRDNCCLILTHCEHLNSNKCEAKKEEVLSKKDISLLTKGGVYFMGSHDNDLLSQFEDDPELQNSLKEDLSKSINIFQEQLLENLMKLKPIVPYSYIDKIVEKRRKELGMEDDSDMDQVVLENIEDNPEIHIRKREGVCNIL